MSATLRLERVSSINPVNGYVLRAKKVKPHSVLDGATRGRHVFFSDGGVRLAAEAIKDNRQPLSEVIVVEDLARTDDEKFFHAYRIRRSSVGPEPSIGNRIKMRVVAQLRSPYASRLLQETGSYVSRIGVDFVNLEKAKT